jgi:hypothetical protein
MPSAIDTNVSLHPTFDEEWSFVNTFTKYWDFLFKKDYQY